MRKLSLIFFIISSIGCSAQMEMKYVGCQYQQTYNKCFINKRFAFIQNKDSVFVNLKLPFDGKEVIDAGLYYNCQLRKDSVYLFEFNKICITDIPEEYYSYYWLNCVFSNTKNCSLFSEIE
jgi:hypothetical protein